MSSYQKYDAALLVIERAVGGAWVPVTNMSSFSYSADYNPDDNQTLIVGSETGALGLSFYDNDGEVLYPGDRIHAIYNDNPVFFEGVIDSTSIAVTYERGRKRTDFSATLASFYAAMMSFVITHPELPAEPAITRIRRYVTVNNWDAA